MEPIVSFRQKFLLSKYLKMSRVYLTITVASVKAMDRSLYHLKNGRKSVGGTIALRKWKQLLRKVQTGKFISL